ncbi:S8 family serine peptidase [Myceligenerans crystallogenes]|uniref:Peptidase S8/S53 domain-containing protein n=1 Tax=Myceligenerans crystallogenes TaxID=316335 RepID=A0ABN2NEE1_9MICO
MRRRIMSGRRAAAALAAALSLAAVPAGGAVPALAGQAGEPGRASAVAPAALVTGQRDGSRQDSADAARRKLSTTLRARLEAETDRPTGFWIRLEDRADLSAASSVTGWADRGRYVYDALTSTAKASQAGVVKELRAAGARYERFWISNAILVTDGDLGLAERLAAVPAVERLHERVTAERIEPVERRAAVDALTGSSDEAVEWGVAAVNAPAVWDLGHTGEGITVSAVDSGADLRHPALASHYRGAREDGTFSHDHNWFDAAGSCAGEPCDTYGHGTHVTGTMVGDDGAENHTGVAPGARWIAANGCRSCADADLLASGQWILAPTRADGRQPDPAMRPHVVNNSWGSQLEGDINGFFADEVAAWEAAGIFAVWAAGNAGRFGCATASSPGANAPAFSVGATTADGEIAVYSSRGPGENGLTKPNVAAPGQDVRSAVPGGGYEAYSGTSMAAPHVAGAVALLWSAVPSLIGDVAATRDLLHASAADHPDDECGGVAGNNNVYGEGDLDVLALVQAAGQEERGHLAGTVAGADGEALDGATVTVADRGTTVHDVVLGAATRTTITHSSSQEIAPGNSAACVEAATQVLRTFTLDDFGIAGDFAVTNVSFGVEVADAGAEVTVNLYTLDGALLYENLELLGSAQATLEAQELTLVDVPVTGVAPAGSTLVVEVAVQDGPFFFVGSNAEPETAPTYIASEPCGHTEPVEVAGTGYPGMHAVIDVTGEAETEVPWLDGRPPAFTPRPGRGGAHPGGPGADRGEELPADGVLRVR